MNKKQFIDKLKKSQPTGIFVVDKIRKRLKHFTAEKPPSFWLDTGFEDLNAVLGSRDKGLPYGRIFQLYGKESSGKTGMSLELAGMAQRDDAAVGWCDAEASWDDQWAAVRGVDLSKIAVFRPYVGKFGNETRMSTAEELLVESLTWIRRASRKYPKVFFAIDSIPALQPQEAAETEMDEYNMKTKLSLASLTSEFLNKWIGEVLARNVMLFLINQVRSSPRAYGNPEYRPGGNAPTFYSSSIVKVKRASKNGGKIKRAGGRQIGITGILTNVKNKTGGGSVEGIQTQYKLFFSKPSKFMEV